MPEDLIFKVALIGVLGIGSQWLARRFNLPAIVLMSIAGPRPSHRPRRRHQARRAQPASLMLGLGTSPRAADMMPMMLSASLLDDFAGVRHGFFTRRGGVSLAPYDSLNCGLGSRDNPDRVAANRERAADRLGFGPDALVTACQVHSAEVAIVDEPWPPEARPRVDALVTRTPGIVLGILTADCAPVLLADAGAGVIAAVHAGWRGAKSGIIEEAVAAMLDLGARRCAMVAAVGPCIQQESYEVGSEFHAALSTDGPQAGAFFRPAERHGHFMFDLPGYVASRLEALAIKAVVALPHDTAADADGFFSYRRTTLEGGGDYGRSLSAIALAAR